MRLVTASSRQAEGHKRQIKIVSEQKHQDLETERETTLELQGRIDSMSSRMQRMSEELKRRRAMTTWMIHTWLQLRRFRLGLKMSSCSLCDGNIPRLLRKTRLAMRDFATPAGVREKLLLLGTIDVEMRNWW